MRSFLHTLLCVLLLLYITHSSYAQADTRFWVNLPEMTSSHGSGQGKVKHIVVSTMGSPATVTASVPADPTFEPIVVDVPANTTERIDFAEFNDLLELIKYDEVTQQGILIESTDIITAYLEVMEQNNPDIFALKGRHALGTEFYTPFQDRLPNHEYASGVQPYASIDIVATEDDTEVTIVPTKDVAKAGGGVHTAGTPITVTLQRGETFSVRAADYTAEAHMGGTHITSSKPIAVLLKDDSVEVGGWDLIGDQMIPVENTGSQYIIMKGNLGHPDYNGDSFSEYAYLTIADDNTEITVNGQVHGTYQAGEQVAVGIVDEHTVIQANDFKKFYCFHISGSSNEIGGALLPPTDQCSGSSQVGFSYSYGTDGQVMHVYLMVRQGAEDGFLIDGMPVAWIDPNAFKPVANGWAAASFGPIDDPILAVGPHIISNTKDLFHMGYLNDTGPGILYGYFSEFALRETSALVVKTNTKEATLCAGEEIQLRVDGGFNYSWRAYDVNSPSEDYTAYLSETNVYNPTVLNTIPTGRYGFEVTIGGKCGEPDLLDTVVLDIVQGPKAQIIQIEKCESEIGSNCAGEFDLTSYMDELSGGYPDLTAVKWEKDVFNQMLMFEDFEAERHLSFLNSDGKVFTYPTDNPLKDGLNTSDKVLRFSNAMSAGQFDMIAKGEYVFDLGSGDVFSLNVLNTVGQPWATNNGPKAITMQLINPAGSIEKKVSLKGYDKWELLTFDFTEFNSDEIYNEVRLIFDVKGVHEQDNFYIDNIAKAVDKQIVKISDPENSLICNDAKVYVTLENDLGCAIKSELHTDIVAGSFAVNSPSVAKVCVDDPALGVAENIDLNDYAESIIGTQGIADGNTIVKWEGLLVGKEQILDDFESERTIDWADITTGSNEKTSIQVQTNPNADAVNSTASVGQITFKSTDRYTATLTFTEAIDLSEGNVFSLDVCYAWQHDWANDATKDHFVEMSLKSEGTVLSSVSGKQSIKSTDRYTWLHLEFDFSAYAGTANVDEMVLNFTTLSHGQITFYTDNLKRSLEPFRGELTDVTDLTVESGDTFFAIVENPDGCKVQAEFTTQLQECGPPVVDHTDTICEDSKNGGEATGIDITVYENIIKDNISENTVTWFSDIDLTASVTDPTDVTANDGTEFYAFVEAPNGKGDTATLTINIQTLPDVMFDDIAESCVGDDAFAITGAMPVNGTFSSVDGLIVSNSSFNPSAEGIFDIVYTATDDLGCVASITKTATVHGFPKPKLLTTDLSYCQDSDVILEIEEITDATYQWYKDDVEMTGENTAVINNALQGFYSVAVTVNGCTDSLSDIQVKGYGLPPYSYNGSDTICEGGAVPEISIDITGNDPWTLTYTDGTEHTVTVTESPFIVPFSETAPGYYDFEVLSIIDKNGCPADINGEKAELLIRSNPVPNLLTTDLSYCTDSDILLEIEAITDATYEWSRDGEILTSETSNLIADATEGVYEVVVDLNGCVGSIDNIEIKGYGTPPYTYFGSDTICEGETIPEVGIEITGNDPWTITYNDGTEHTVEVTESPFIFPFTETVAGYYDFEIISIIDKNGCPAEYIDDKTEILIKPNPLAELLSTDLDYCGTSDITLEIAEVADAAYSWTKDGLVMDSKTSAVINNPEAGLYDVEINVNGCTDNITGIEVVGFENPAFTLGTDEVICEGKEVPPLTINFEGNAPWQFTYNDGSENAVEVTETSFVIPLAEVDAGTYTVSVTSIVDANGCMADVQADDAIELIIHPKPESPWKPAIKTTFCSNDEQVNLEEWVVVENGVFTGSSIDNTLFDPQTSSEESFYLYYEYEDDNQCAGLDSVLVEVNTVPSAEIKAIESKCITSEPVVLEVEANAIIQSGSFRGKGIADDIFTPETAGVGAHWAVYDFTTVDGCMSSDSVQLLVNGLPELTFDLPPSICESLEMLDITPEPYHIDHSIFYGAEIVKEETEALFDSQVNGKGIYTITYEYQDPITQCVNSIEKDIEVVKAEKPLVTGNSENVQNIPPVLPLNAEGEGIVWYRDSLRTQKIGDGNVFYPEDFTEVGTYTFWACQTIGVCESAPAKVEWIVTACPTPSPHAFDLEVCENESGAEIKATGSGGDIIWEYEGEDIFTGDKYEPSMETVGEYQYKIREYNAEFNCYSPTSPVLFTIHALPDVSIVADDTVKICVDADTYELTVSPEGGSFVGSGMSGNEFSPDIVGKGLYDIEYIYIDDKSCESRDTVVFEVNKTEPLQSKSFYFVENNINPEIVIEAADGAVVYWYVSDVSETPINNGVAFTHGETTPVENTYFVSQVLNGCESERVPVWLTITDCATPPPVIDEPNRYVCEYSEKEEFIAQTVDASATVSWFNEDGSPIGSGETFSPDIITNVYYAVQDTGCQSPPTFISITVHEDIVPQVLIPSAVCEGENNGEIKTVSGNVNTYWFANQPAYPADTTLALARTDAYIPAESATGKYDIWAVEFKEGCLSSEGTGSYAIKAIPEKPVLNSAWQCEKQQANELTAVGETIKWYPDEDMSVVLKTDNAYRPDIALVGAHLFYASQTVDGCESVLEEVIYEIREETNRPTLESETICSHYDLPVVEAENVTGTVLWYLPNETESFADGAEYQVEKGQTELYATQTVNECESPKEVYLLTIVPQPEKPFAEDVEICQQLTQVSIKTSGANAKWYSDTTASQIGEGGVYKHSGDVVGNNRFYVNQTVDGCTSYFTEVGLFIKPVPATPAIETEGLESCEGEVLNFAVTNYDGVSSLNWYTNNGKKVAEGENFNPQDYIFTNKKSSFTAKHILDGCESEEAKMSYFVNPLPEAPVVFADNICFGEEQALVTAISDETVQWLNDADEVMAEGERWDMINEIPFPGQYSALARSVSDAGCLSSVAEYEFTVGRLPSPVVTGEEIFCLFDDKQPYSVETSIDGSSLEWIIDDIHTLKYDNREGTEIGVVWNKEGVYDLTVIETSELGCAQSNTMQVTVVPVPYADFSVARSVDEVTFENETQTDILELPSGEVEIKMTAVWDFNNGSEDLEVSWNNFYDTQEAVYDYGYYTVGLTVENEYGCISYVENGFAIQTPNNLFIPNAFAPDHDAEGVSVFQPKGTNLIKYDIKIYDSWGNLVWYSDVLEDGSPAEGWDGTYKGVPMKPDTYTWKIEALFEENVPWEGVEGKNGELYKFGTIILIR